MVIYGRDSESEENQLKVEVPMDHGAQRRNCLAMFPLKFEWTKCSAIAILEKMMGELVVAIVNTRS